MVTDLPLMNPLRRLGGSKGGDLLKNLAHLSLGEGLAVELVDALIVLEKPGSPVVDQSLFGGVTDDPVGIVPSVLL